MKQNKLSSPMSREIFDFIHCRKNNVEIIYENERERETDEKKITKVKLFGQVMKMCVLCVCVHNLILIEVNEFFKMPVVARSTTTKNILLDTAATRITQN